MDTFFDVVQHELSPEEQQGLLLFWTGLANLPLGGFQSLPCKPQLWCANEGAGEARASVCGWGSRGGAQVRLQRSGGEGVCGGADVAAAYMCVKGCACPGAGAAAAGGCVERRRCGCGVPTSCGALIRLGCTSSGCARRCGCGGKGNVVHAAPSAVLPGSDTAAAQPEQDLGFGAYKSYL